jgi:hypothetical protein
VRDFQIDQGDCYRVLIDTGFPCISISSLLRNEIEEVQPPLDPDSRDTDAIVFVKPELLKDQNKKKEETIRKLKEHSAFKEFYQLSFVPRKLCRGYTIGTPLNAQPGAAPFSGQLSRAFAILGFVGLVDRGLLETKFAHSSILMLMRRALGLETYTSLIPFIERPARFFALAISNSVEPPLSEELIDEIEDALLDSTVRRPERIDTKFDEVTLEYEETMKLLRRIKDRHSSLMGRFERLEKEILMRSRSHEESDSGDSDWTLEYAGILPGEVGEKIRAREEVLQKKREGILQRIRAH